MERQTLQQRRLFLCRHIIFIEAYIRKRKETKEVKETKEIKEISGYRR